MSSQIAITLSYLSGGPNNVVGIDLGGTNPVVKSAVNLTPFVNLTSFQGGDNGLEGVIGFEGLSALKDFQITGTNTVSFDISSLPVNLETVNILGNNLIFGNINTLKHLLKYIRIDGNNLLTGNFNLLSSLCPNLEHFEIRGASTFSGNISSISSNLKYLAVGSSAGDTLTGNLSTIPYNTNLITFAVGGQSKNTISGNISNFNSQLSNLQNILIRGFNTISGDINTVSPSLTGGFIITGSNTLSGDIGGLSNVSYIELEGNNTTTGNLSQLLSTTFYENFGNNTTVGDLNTLPTTLTYYNNRASSSLYGPLTALSRFPALEHLEHGGTGSQNNVTGNLSSLQLAPSLKYFDFGTGTGQHNIFGNIKDLPEGLLRFRHFTSGIVTGNIEDLPRSLDYYGLGGGDSNVTTGNLSGLPSNLRWFITTGPVNTIFGNVKDLPRSIIDYRNYGGNTVTGVYADLPRGLTVYDNRGENTVGGFVQDLPVNLITFRQYGKGQIVGNVTDLPTPKIQILDVSSATVESGSAAAIIQGDISQLKNVVPVIKSIRLQTGSTVTGNVSSLVGLNSLESLNLRGDNTVYGDISVINSLPSIINFIVTSPYANITGNLSSIKNSSMSNWLEVDGSITGDIANLPTQLQSFVTGPLGGTIYGSLSTLPSNIYIYINTNVNSQAFSYYDGTGGNGYGKKLWRNGMHNITLQPSGSNVIPVTHLVTLLVDLSGYTWSVRGGIGPIFNVGGSNNPTINTTTYPEAAQAITALQSKGVTVTLNTTT